MPINKRRSIEQFINHVRLALNDDDGAKSSKVKVRNISARASDYIAAYHILAQTKTNDENIGTKSTKERIDKM